MTMVYVMVASVAGANAMVLYNKHGRVQEIWQEDENQTMTIPAEYRELAMNAPTIEVTKKFFKSLVNR